jgi:hypothetical protein
MVRLSPPVLKSSTPVDVQNGTLVEGKVTSAELIGPLTGKTITELVQLFNNRQTYLNIPPRNIQMENYGDR